MIYIDAKRAGFDEMIAAGLVLTGGTACLPGVDELAEQVLGMPVRIGVPKGIHGLADSLNSPSYAASVGLLRWACLENGHNGHKPGLNLNIPFQLGGIADTARRWVRALIPN